MEKYQHILFVIGAVLLFNLIVKKSVEKSQGKFVEFAEETNAIARQRSHISEMSKNQFEKKSKTNPADTWLECLSKINHFQANLLSDTLLSH